MNLTPMDLEQHANLGIPVELLAANRVRRVDDREGRELLGVKHHGDLSGIVYPRIHPVLQREVGYRIRRTHPEIEAGRPKNKYVSSVDRAHLYFVVGTEMLLKDTSVLVTVVESEKAALAITAWAQRVGRTVLAIGLGGCWGFRGRIGKTVDENGARVDEHGLLPDFDLVAWHDRDVVILFDGDKAINPSIAAASRELTKHLRDRKARVRCIDVPPEPDVNGPDDYLGRRGDEAFGNLLDTTPTATSTYKRSDAGNAEMFAALHQDDIRYDHAARLWRVWSGHHWATDRDRTVHRLAKDVMRSRLESATSIVSDDERKAEVKWAIASESRRGLDALLAIAQSERPLAVTGDGWDRHPMLYPTQNGVIELETGRLRDGRREDGISRVAPVSYDPTAMCPRWERFVREIFAANPEIAEYLKRVVGYTLTGNTSEQAIWILFGTGANGKSKLMETLMHTIFGADFAWTMPFPSSSWTDSMSEYQKAALAGKRLVASSEVAKQGRLNEELVKSLTGSDSVNARHPYGRPFQFVPHAKFFLRVNDKPQIRDESHGMWRRIKLIPFTQTFAVDTTLGATLATEAPGILRWAVQGCLDWQRDGLHEPAIVSDATAEYRDEQDQLSEFLIERCLVIEGVSVRAKPLYDCYKQWAGDHVPRNVSRKLDSACVAGEPVLA